MKFELESNAFLDGGIIPDLYSSTRAGRNVSPPLIWKNPPKGTKSFVVSMEDLDIPFGFRFTHWLIFNIPADVSKLDEGIQRSCKPLNNGAIQGRNGYCQNGYLGPNPIRGKHRYQFVIYALDIQLPSNLGVTRKKLLLSLSGHVLDKAFLIGNYTKK